MANHGFAAPTADFAYDGGTDPGVFRLQATRNMTAGDEVRKKGRQVTHTFCFTQAIVGRVNPTYPYVGEAPFAAAASACISYVWTLEPADCWPFSFSLS